MLVPNLISANNVTYISSGWGAGQYLLRVFLRGPNYRGFRVIVSIQIMIKVPIDQDLLPDIEPGASNNGLQQDGIPLNT